MNQDKLVEMLAHLSLFFSLYVMMMLPLLDCCPPFQILQLSNFRLHRQFWNLAFPDLPKEPKKEPERM